MSPRYMEALAEVNYVINGLDIYDRNKIPDKFLSFIEENKDKRYDISKIDVESLKEETYAILAFIYRKFLASDEEREKLELEYQEKLKLEKETIKNNVMTYEGIEYTPKVIGKNRPKEIKGQLIEYKADKWYEKIFNKIKRIIKNM